MSITISVIMSIKDGEKFIARSFSGIFSQTHLPSEIVVVDDGSTDGTLKELELIKLISNVPIKILVTQGLGRAKALNLAAKSASSMFIANLDVDDFWSSEKLLAQYRVLSRIERPEMSILVTGSELLYESGSNGKREEVKGKSFEPIGNEVMLSKGDFYLSNPVNHSSIIYSKYLFEKVGGYTESLAKQIDIDMWVKFLLTGGDFYMIPAPLTVKCLHSEQSFESSSDRISYSWSAFIMTNRNLCKLDSPFYYHVLSAFKLVYNLMPGFLKVLIRRARVKNA